MGTPITAFLDIEARIAKLLIIVMVSFVAIIGRALMELMTIHAVATHLLRARTVKQLTIAIIGTVLIMENVTTMTKHTIVRVI